MEMPRYFFDLQDAENEYRDKDGVQLADLRAAKEDGLQALIKAMQEALPKVPSREFSFKIRDQLGRHVFKATIGMSWKVSTKAMSPTAH